MDLNAGQLTRLYSGLMLWTNGACKECWTFAGMTLSEMPTVALPTSHHFHQPILTFFWHLARMDENTDASQAIFEPPPESWRRPLGRLCTAWMENIHDDLSSLDLEIYEARDLVQNRPLWRLVSAQCCVLIVVHATIELDTGIWSDQSGL